MRSPTRTIVIVGGGFCGTVLAANLLRRSQVQPLRIVLVERRPEIGRGVAYQCGPGQYLLNVPAGRMAADTCDPGQFVRFAQRHMGSVAAGDFLPRRLYGDYLRDLLKSAEQTARSHVHFERVCGEARAVRRNVKSGSFVVELADGSLNADEVVLACGDPAPVCPAFARNVVDHPGFVRDPYGEGALRDGAMTMLVIGTGLTAADAIVSAATLSPGMTIHAISRHGLLPAAQGGGNFSVNDLDWPAARALRSLTARQLVRDFRDLARAVEHRGGDWRDAMTMARHAVPGIWQELPMIERKRFLRHGRTYWDIHRHRLPPVIAARVAELRSTNRLHIHAGHVLGIDGAGGSLSVRWRPRGTSDTAQQLVDRVVNCTGPDRRLEHCRDPLFVSLLDSGLATIDPLGIGLRTGRNGSLIGRNGQSSAGLFYLGPLLRAQHWEATAVGELRGHVEQLARSLTSELAEVCAAPS